VAYVLACTPGYYNGELQASDERDSRSSAYMRSAIEFKDLLAAWRVADDMDGLIRTPIEQ
jgi:hypothetical protein